jgi:hypothetical protein
MGAILTPQLGVPPDDAVTEPAREVLEAVVAHGTRRAPALTLLALLAFWSGDGARATARIEAALCADPGHNLALIVAGALNAGMPPGWVVAARDAG